jgi:hypothetical protein
MHQIIAALLLVLPLSALDLTSFEPFTGTEEQAKVFSFDDLLARATPAEAFERFVVIDISSNGALQVGSSSTGPWSNANVSANIASGTWLKFTPSTNVQGTRVIMSVKGGIGPDLSDLCNVTINLANTPDPITATAGVHLFPQPGGGPVVSEDTAYTFTHTALANALTIVEPDPEPYSIIITAVLTGTLRTGADQPITLPYTLASGNSVRWTPPLNAYTKSGEDPMPVLRAYGRTDANSQRTVSTELHSVIAGVTDDLGGSLTLTGFSDITVVRGITRTFTYEELHRHAVGTNDVDRLGAFNLDFLPGSMDGLIIRTYFANGALIAEQTAPSGVTFNEGWTIQFLAPETMSIGRHSPLQVNMLRDTFSSSFVQSGVVVQSPAAPGGSGGDGGGSGGGCAAGTGGLLIALASALGLAGRRKWRCAG